jgi:XisH protein
VARDYFHPLVKAALIREGWQITHDPYELKVGGVDMEVDLGAEQIIAAERQDRKVAIEIKSFLVGGSAITEFHRALGQFINYRMALRTEDPDRLLYLAIPVLAFSTFFQLDFSKAAVAESQIKLLIYDPNSEADLVWIP